ncbi:MAG: hypothetical protein PUC64_06570 [Clostridium sp.]|nr:hypothetical protein [Clostridium sp.]
MSKIDFSQIENMLNSSSDFSLSETQYEKLTGRKMPKDNSYLIQKSALSKFAESMGLRITVQERVISFEKNECR